MTKQVQLRRGSHSQHSTFTGAVGEPTIDTTNVVIVIHDGVTAGGHSMVGEKSVQDIVNKRTIAIGKSEASDAEDAQLDVLGNTLVSDDVNAGSLKVLYRAPITRTGFTSATPSTLVTLTTSTDIRTGWGVTSGNVNVGTQILDVDVATGIVTLTDLTTDSTAEFSDAYFTVSNGRSISGIDTSTLEVGDDIEDPDELLFFSGTTITEIREEEIIISTNTAGTTTGVSTFSCTGTAGGTTLTLSDTSSLTDGDLLLGDEVFIPDNCTIVNVDSGTQITISAALLDSGTNNVAFASPVTIKHVATNIENDYEFFYPDSGIATITRAYINDAVIETLNITTLNGGNLQLQETTTDLANINVGIHTFAFIGTSYTEESNINVAITTSSFISSSYISTSYVNTGITTTAFIDTAYIDNANLNVGIQTFAFISTSYVDEQNVNLGLATDYTFQTSRNILGLTDVGITTTQFTNVEYVDTANINLGISTLARMFDALADNINIDVGIASYFNAGFAGIDTAQIKTGFGTFFNIENSTIDSLFVATGIGSTTFATESYVDQGYINVGIMTEVGISTANIDNAFVDVGITSVGFANTTYTDHENVNVGFTTTAYLDTANINVGIGTTVGIASFRAETAYIDVGIATQITVERSIVSVGQATTSFTEEDYVNVSNVNTGLTTMSFVETEYVNLSNVNVGIGTTLFQELSYTDTGYVRSGINTYLDVTGIGSVQDLKAAVGVITQLTGSDLNYTGFSTIGQFTAGVGNTDVIVDGDFRVSGLVTFGQGDVTINDDGDIYNVGTLMAPVGVITNMSGTNLNYTGISTIGVASASQVTITGQNTALNQDKSVRIKLSNAGIASDYDFILPSKLGSPGQLLAIQTDGTLGFTTNGAGLFESRYYVSEQNGSDDFDGRALPVASIKKATQLASFDSFVIPGQRYLDAGDLIENNVDFIVEEAFGALEFNYENLTTDYPEYNRNDWKDKIVLLLENLQYDIRFGGNSKAVETALDLYKNGIEYYDGEEVIAIYLYNYIKFIVQYIVNNQTPPTLYGPGISTTGISSQTQYFDLTITQDPENTNLNYFHTSKDARNLILANKLEIVDKSLAAIAVGVTNGNDFYFPGDTQSNERSRFYSAYRLIQKNRQEIIDYAWADTVATYPGISATEDKCKRDIGYFVDAVSTDVFTGGNNYARSFVGFYFDSGAPLGNGLLGEEVESNHAFTEAAVGMSSALTNNLTIVDNTIPADPATGSNTDTASCANVRSTVNTLLGIVTTSVAAGSTAGIGTTSNYGYFLISPTLNVSDSVGIGSTNIFGGRKCARDLNYFVDTIAQDIAFDSNQNTIYSTKLYFDGAGNLLSNGVAGEQFESILAFNASRDLMKKAITNQLNNRDLTVIADSETGFNTDPNSCSTTQTQIGNLVGILTTALDTASLAGIGSTSFGITDCSDVRQALVNYIGIVTAVIGAGNTSGLPEVVLPETQSKPICIFVEAGNYIEDNPLLIYDDVAIVGDNLRNTIIRPKNAGKDLFRVRNGCYVTGFAMKDNIDAAGVPQFTFNNAVAYDDPADQFTSRTGYATKLDKPLITRSPYIQNCSILSFLGGNGILVDGNLVRSPNSPIVAEEAELDPDNVQPEQGKSMVAAAFTMVSFNGIGWRVINDGYSQVVSCFQIFCRYGSLTQSGGYLSITNSATNFGLFALRSTGFSPASFKFDRGRIAETGTSGGLTTLKVVGLGNSTQDLYVTRFFDNDNNDVTANFKTSPTVVEFIGAASTQGGAVDLNLDQITLTAHPFQNGDSVIYEGDEQDVPIRVLGGLVSQNQYYLKVIDVNTVEVFEDDGLATKVDLTATTTGINTFKKNTQEFFATEVLTRHNIYQSLTLATGIGTVNFVSGRQVTQAVSGGSAVGIALTYNNSSRELVVSVELSGDVRRNFQVTDGVNNLNISSHDGSPVSAGITQITGISTYWTTNSKIDSTLTGGNIVGVSNLPETYKLHFHRPSIINSSSHTWEYSGSGVDYNALPQNGGQTDTSTEQVAEGGGRVFSSGTNELGDFKIGDFITAFNRTGNIIFNNTVSIGNLDSIRLSLSGGVAVEEFSTDQDLGDNEIGGPLNKRVSTQLAVRGFLNNRLGGFIDKNVSTNAVPGAIVQLNNIGQINPDLIPPKTVNFFRAKVDDGRTQLVNQIPAVNLQTGDTVVEPSFSYVLVTDVLSQYLILDNDTIYDFDNGFEVKGTVSDGGAIGIVTAPPSIGINTDTLSFPEVGYGSTGLVRGVALTLTNLTGGTEYPTAGIYTGVRLDTSSGIGTGITGEVTVGGSGTVTSLGINTGGRYFAVGDVVTLYDHSEVGGVAGVGTPFTATVGSVETRLYLKLTNNQKFTGSAVLTDYIADGNAVAITTSQVGSAVSFTFTPTDIAVGGDIDFAQDRILCGAATAALFENGDPLFFTVDAGTPISPLALSDTYYVKKVGVGTTAIELYTNYALTTKIDLDASGTGTSNRLTRRAFDVDTNQIVIPSHGLTQGDPLFVDKVGSGSSLPTGIETGFYFAGSVTVNSFTLHDSRQDSLNSINGLLFATEAFSAVGFGTVSITKQNITYEATVNTSSSDATNWSLNASSSIDASNIISGTVDPSRLGSGEANTDTFLRGDSSFQKIVTSVGIGTTQPFDVTSTLTTFAPNGVGINTYQGNITLGLNRVESTLDEYSTLGIAQYKLSTFSVGDDGRLQIKNAASGGDIDAATFDGNGSAFYLDINNIQGNIPIARGGTGLQALPSNGAILIGNGVSYDLTANPEFAGDVTFSGGNNAMKLSANCDFVLTNSGSWTGEKGFKLQAYNSNLYAQYSNNFILRNSSGTNRLTLSASGTLTLTGSASMTRLTLTQSTGTAPLTITSTTLVTNLNADRVDNLHASSFLRSDANDTTTGQIIFTKSNSTSTGGGQIYLNGSNGNRIDWRNQGVANPSTGTRSTGTKMTLWSNVDANSVDYAFGIASSTLWYSVPTTAQVHRWFGGTQQMMALTNNNLDVTGEVRGRVLRSDVANGTAPLIVTSQTKVTNLNADLLDGMTTSSSNQSSASIVSRDSSGNFRGNEIKANHFVRGSQIGNSSLSISETDGNNDSQVALSHPGGQTFGILAWDADTFLSSGIYYSNGNWIHQNVNNNNNMLRMVPGTGVTWYSSNNGSGSWNVSSNKTLWNSAGIWQQPLSRTLTMNTSGTGISGSASFNNSGSVTFTVSSNATSSNNANTIVSRNGSGDFNARYITATRFRVTADTNTRLENDQLIIRGGSPTVIFRDTNHNSGMVHVNSNIFYVLRGSNDAESWTQVNSVWPLQINLTNNNATFGGTVTASSDVRFKKNITTIEGALDRVLRMRGVFFERLETPGTECGVIAQEVQEVLPEVVTETDGGHLSVAYGNISGLLIQAIKEQQEQIEELREEIRKLKGE